MPEYTGIALVYGLLNQEDVPEVDFSIGAETTGVFSRKGFFFSAFTHGSRARLYWVSSREKANAEKLADPEQIREIVSHHSATCIHRSR